MTSSTSSSRSRAIAQKMPRKRNPPWDTYWIPGVNNLRQYGRWAFAEFTDVYQIDEEFNALIERFTSGHVVA